MEPTEYTSPFGSTGAETTTAMLEGFEQPDPGDEWGITSTGSTSAGSGERSPLDAMIADSNWTREDVELAVRILSTVATIGALYLAYQRGGV